MPTTTDPGNNIATAYDFGALTYNLTPPLAVPVFNQYTDTLGGGDSDDYFKFTIDKTLGIDISLSALFNTTLELLRVDGSLITTGTGLYYSNNIGQNLDAGTYYIHLLTGNTTANNYNLNFVLGPLDNAGNDLQSAKDVGTLTATPVTNNDTVFSVSGISGGFSDYDYYKFTLTQTSTVNINLTDEAQSSTFLSLLSNNGFGYSSSESLFNDSSQTNASLQKTLGAGTYYVDIYGGGAYNSSTGQSLPTNYTLSLSTITVPDPGNTRATAYDFGALTYNLTPPLAVPVLKQYTDSVGGSDSDDYFQFSIDKTLGIGIHLSADTNTTLELLRADGSIITTQTGQSFANIGQNLDAGTYYLHLLTGNTTVSSYNLSLVAGPLDNAGNNQQSAKDVGTLTATPVINNDTVFRVSGNIGDFSDYDYYKFTLTQTSTVNINLTDEAQSYTALSLLDNNNNQPGYLTNDFNQTSASLQKTLGAGTYYVSINGSGASSSTGQSLPTNYTLSLSTTVVELPVITLTANPLTVTEDGIANLVYTFTRTGDLTNSLFVYYSIGGTVTNGIDYGSSGSLIPGGVYFAPNSATATLIIDPTADTIVEPDETVALTLASSPGYTVGTTTAVTGTILNDDTLPSITLDVSPNSVTEDGNTNLVYTFTRTGDLTNSLFVNYTISGTATNGIDYGIDYASPAPGVIAYFAPNSTTATVIIDPTADTIVEPDETVALTLASSPGYTVGTTTAVTGTILNDDTLLTLPTITLDVSPNSVAEDGTNNLVYTFTRTGDLTNSLFVNYSIGGTATNGIDYAPTFVVGVYFDPNSATATLIIDPTADTIVEPDETVALTLASSPGYTVGTTTAVTGTITNDDTNNNNNDNFANRTVLTGQNITTTGSNIGFTDETGESIQSGNINSAWWSWTATTSTPVTIDTIGSNFDTYLSVFTGNAVNALTIVASNDDGGGSLTSKVSFTPTPGTTYQIAVDGYSNSTGNIALNLNLNTPPNVPDFNSDGNTDLLWQNPTTGEVGYWYMNNSTLLGGAIAGSAPLEWKVAGTGDFNQDGKDDLLWQNTATGQVGYWYMNNSTLLGGEIAGSAPLEWKVAGTGDFNKDGKDDLLWQNTSTGEVGYWYMDNTNILSGAIVGSVSLDWKLVGTGDFNQDGKDDLLWQNTSTGEVGYWYMDNSSLLGTAIAGSAPLDWKVAGTGDFNKDGKDDLLWQNTTTGQVGYWYMDNSSVLGTAIAGAAQGWNLI